MKRRNLLKGIAASSVVGAGMASASADAGVKRRDVQQFDRLRIVRDGRTVGTVEGPTWDAVRDVQASLDEDQRLVTPDDTCVAFCESNCPCKPCMVGCFDCCNPAEDKCDNCS